MILVLIPAAWKAGPSADRMNTAWSAAVMTILGLLPPCSGSFCGVMASMVIPCAFIAWIYRTKYCAYTAKYSGLRLPPTKLLLSFIHNGADHGLPSIFVSGLIARIS